MLDVVDQAVYDGWRYLGLDGGVILSKTPREFSIMMAAQVEKRYDDYEQMASMALMVRQAYHAKNLKHSQLFKRPVDDETAKSKLNNAENRMQERMERLSKYEEFAGKLGDIGEEDTNG